MSSAELVYLAMGVALVVYTVSAGADFGAGIWDLFARGATRDAQRKALEKAIAPIWEANHVWLIFVIVVLFTAFPRAFAVLGIAFHVPLTMVLVGIVLRGSSFVFRAYGITPSSRQELFGRVFGWSSAITPLFLGMVLGGMSSGAVAVSDGVVTSGYAAGWTSLYAIAVGIFATVLFALLAAVYMTLDAPPEVAEIFRRRALACELVAGPIALATFLLASAQAPVFAGRFGSHPFFWPLQAGCAVMAALAALGLWRRRYALARWAVVAQVGLVVLGWGVAMSGDLLLGAVSITNAGAHAPTLDALLLTIAGGAVLLVPSLALLFRQFKSSRT